MLYCCSLTLYNSLFLQPYFSLHLILKASGNIFPCPRFFALEILEKLQLTLALSPPFQRFRLVFKQSSRFGDLCPNISYDQIKSFVAAQQDSFCAQNKSHKMSEAFRILFQNINGIQNNFLFLKTNMHGPGISE